MKKSIQFILLIFFVFSYSQKSNTTNCLVAKKKRLLEKQKIILFYSNDSTIVIEKYSSGMGIFSGVQKDTLFLKNDKFISNNLEINFIKKSIFKIYYKEVKSSKKYKYKVKSLKDPDVLYTRNLTYREEIKYKIVDKEKYSDFVKQTDKLILQLDHNSFKNKVKEILNELKIEI